MSLLRTRPWLAYLGLCVLTLAALGWQLVRNPSHEERDVVQERLDQACVPLGPEHTIGQIFVAQHAGLKAIELLLVVYDPQRELPPSGHILLTLERLDEPTCPPIRAVIATGGLEHNQGVRFSFPPLADSQGATYRFTLSSEQDHGLGFWHTTSDAYALGHMLDDGDEQPGDLHFVTVYDYHLSEILGDVGDILRNSGRWLPATLVVLLVPGGALLLCFLRQNNLDGPTVLALAITLSAAFWPLLLLWTSVVGIRLGPGAVWAILGILLACGVYGAWWRRVWRSIRRPQEASDPLPSIALAVVVLLTLATRLIQIRELVVPAWVDSVHHTMLVRLISEQGVVPMSYQPYMPVQDLHYHYGFHANVAALIWLTGLPAHQAVLFFAQVLNAAALLPVYALTRSHPVVKGCWLSRRRWAGVVAALVVASLSYLPAYYVTWGRYTHLTGLLLLPTACLVTSWLLTERAASRGLWTIATILVAGLALTHYRVLVFYALFWLALLWVRPWTRVRPILAGARLVQVAVSLAGLALVAILPWAARFVLRVAPRVESIYGSWLAADQPSPFPIGLLNAGWTRPLLYAAGAGGVWGALRRRHEIVLVLLWVGLWLLVANLHLLGLPDWWLMPNSAVVISFWLPVSILCGWLAGDLLALLIRGGKRRLPSSAWEWLFGAGLFGLVLALAGWGSWHSVDVINPVTVLVTADDMRAIDWVSDNTPPQARFLINTRQWQGDIHMGTDGGWWLPLLAGRDVTLPSVLYRHGSPSYYQAIGDLASTVEDAESLDDPALIARLGREGVTHVYVGARGGRLMPKELDPSPHYQLRYASGPARVYEFVPDP